MYITFYQQSQKFLENTILFKNGNFMLLLTLAKKWCSIIFYSFLGPVQISCNQGGGIGLMIMF